jgi:DNA-binding response OmpR family regulator
MTPTKTVLVVEDDPAARELLRAALAFAGFSVFVAGDGLNALHVLEQHTPDAIVLDLDLPTFTGLAVREELRFQDRTKDIPIVIVTGTDWRPPVDTAATLRKPVLPDDVVAMVKRALKGDLAEQD